MDAIFRFAQIDNLPDEPLNNQTEIVRKCMDQKIF
jgi:hypothetical protein